MSKRTHFEIGQTFGRLSVVDQDFGKNKKGLRLILVDCTCGSRFSVLAASLIHSNTRSCGCLQREKAAVVGASQKTHGMKNSPEYTAWRSIKKRCLVPTNAQYPNYGGRGISICERWASSFESFFLDMGLRPSEDYSIDRINNDGPYTKENCRWATKTEQAENRRSTVWVEFRGERLTITEIARRVGLSQGTLQRRYRKLNDIEKAIVLDGRWPKN